MQVFFVESICDDPEIIAENIKVSVCVCFSCSGQNRLKLHSLLRSPPVSVTWRHLVDTCGVEPSVKLGSSCLFTGHVTF